MIALSFVYKMIFVSRAANLMSVLMLNLTKRAREQLILNKSYSPRLKGLVCFKAKMMINIPHFIIHHVTKTLQRADGSTRGHMGSVYT